MSITNPTSIAEINRLFSLQSETGNLMQLRSQTVRQRLDKIRRIEAYLMRPENILKLTTALQQDLKKPAAESEANELAPVLMALRHIQHYLRRWMQNRKVETPLAMSGLSSHIRYESKGAVLVMSPWNYPFQLTLVPLLHAVAAGNAVMVKPSEFTPATSAFLDEMIRTVFAEHEVAFVFGDGAVAEHLLRLRFHHIFFTGSPNVGRKVMKAASEHLIPVTLELGGKSPVIVDETANVRHAARKIAWAKTMNCGQTCIAPDYLLIHESQSAEFVDSYQEAVHRMFNRDGKGVDQSADYPRIIDQRHFNRITGMMSATISAGASILAGGTARASDCFIEPTLLGNVTIEMPIMKDEIFGPVLPMITYRHTEEAIRIINEMERPLALYIISKSKKNIQHVLQHTTSGGVGINELMTTSVNPFLPFGGINHSGIGRSNGYAGFVAFSNERGIVKRSWGTFAPIYPPYNKTIIRWLRRLARL